MRRHHQLLSLLLLVGCADGTTPPPEVGAVAPAPTPAPSQIQVAIDDLGGGVGVRLSGGWGGRALDPVLVVGGERFTRYDFPAPGQIRFTVPDRSLLVPTAHAHVAFGAAEQVDITAAYQEALR